MAKKYSEKSQTGIVPDSCYYNNMPLEAEDRQGGNLGHILFDLKFMGLSLRGEG